MRAIVATAAAIAILCAAATALGDECLEGDCQNGTGTKLYSIGIRYTGGFKDGYRDGLGWMIMPDSSQVIGHFVKDAIQEGMVQFYDGTRYIGQWQFRERNGLGLLTYADGRTYIGEFKSEQRHGNGMMIYPDGRKYMGAFQNGIRNGKGTMLFTDGRIYHGEFQRGQRSGKGILILPDGTRQEGRFDDGRYLGP